MPEIELNIPNEWGQLEAVIVGHGRHMGPRPTLETAFDPTSKFHLAQGSFPTQAEVATQLDGLAELLEEEGVSVLRPSDLSDVEQVFARDVGLVIDGTFIRSRTIEARRGEWDGVAPLLGNTPWTALPPEVRMEGGDVIVLDGSTLCWSDATFRMDAPAGIPDLAFGVGLFSIHLSKPRSGRVRIAQRRPRPFEMRPALGLRIHAFGRWACDCLS